MGNSIVIQKNGETGKGISCQVKVPIHGEIDTREEAVAALSCFEKIPSKDRALYTAIVRSSFESFRYSWQDLLKIRDQPKPALVVKVELPKTKDTFEWKTKLKGIDLPGGVEFNDVDVGLRVYSNGQKIHFSYDPQGEGGFSFKTLPGPDGKPLPFHLVLGLEANENEKGNALSGVKLTFTSKSSHVSGKIAGADEIVLDLYDLVIGPDHKEGATGLEGKITLQKVPIDLSELTLSGSLPHLQLRLDKKTGQMTLIATPLPPPQEVSDLSQKNAGDWLRMGPKDWESFDRTLRRSNALFTVTEKLADLSIIPGLEQVVPRGGGEVRFYLKSNSPDGDLPRFTMDLGDTQASETLKKSIVVVRTNPNPPARDDDDGEPIVLSRAQSPGGTLFFLKYKNPKDKNELSDGDLWDELKALGVPQSSITNGRMELDDFLTPLMKNEAISRHLSRDNLRGLIVSYLEDPPHGSHKRNGHRLLITLGLLMRSGEDAPLVLEKWKAVVNSPLLVKPHRKDLYHLTEKILPEWKRRIETNQYDDDRFYDTPKGGDGSAVQYRAVLPLPPSEVARLLTTTPSHRFDPWITSSTLLEGGEKITLLGRDYQLVKEQRQFGSVITLHSRLNGSSPEEAYTRTIRLVPVKVKQKTETLILMEEHRDQSGDERKLPYPRLLRGPGTPLNKGTLITGALPAIEAITKPRTDVVGLGDDRINAILSNLLRLHEDPNLPREEVTRSHLYLNGSRTHTVRVMDYLEFDQTDPKNPLLIVSEIPRDQNIQDDFQKKLGIEPSLSQAWLRPRKSPRLGDSRELRQIPLRDLFKATKLGQQGMSFETFTGLTHLLLAPPKEIQGSMRKLTSTKNRYLAFVREMQETLGVGADDIAHETDGTWRMNFLVFDSPAFHSLPTPGNQATDDTVDSLVSFFIPAKKGQTLTPRRMADVGLHAEEYHRLVPQFYPSAKLIPKQEVAGANPERRYMYSILEAGAKVPQPTSSPETPTCLEGGVCFAQWQMEELVAKMPGYEEGFYENWGLWIYYPLKLSDGSEGIYGGRYSITNIKALSDRSPMAAKLARDNLPTFLSAKVGEGFRLDAGLPIGSKAVPPIKYTPGRSIDENGKPK